ncbi:hypothetical protein DL98DRAFT_576777 [Cadophora sp. DSE1049]|nr:hypothetical protein DL98DRAFT_576777 [Cadophora sp. DSE1049]
MHHSGPAGSSQNRQSAEDPAKDLPEGEVPKDLPNVRSPSEDQPTTQVQAGDQQTAEAAANQQTEKAPKDTSGSESLPNSRSTTEGFTASLPEREISIEPTKSSSQDQSTAERPSEDVTEEGLPIITAAAKSLPGSRDPSGARTAKSDQEPQKDLPSNPPSSDTVKDTSQSTKHEANRQKRRDKSGKRVQFQPSKGNTTIVDLTGIDSEDEFERSTFDSLYRPSPSPEKFKIVRGEYDGEQIREETLHKTHTTGDTNSPDQALPVSPETSTTKAFEDESSSRCKAHQSRPHKLVTSTKRQSNSSKRLLRTANDEVDDRTTSHKRPKLDKDATLPDSRINSPHDAKTSGDESKAQSKRKTCSRFKARSLKSHIDNESGWLDAASLGCTKIWERSLRNTGHLSDLIKLEDESNKLLTDILENMTPQASKAMAPFVKVEERRREHTSTLYRNGISDYGECESMKKLLEQWALEDKKVSKRIEKSS